MMVWERDFPDTWIFNLHTHLFFLLSTCICHVLLLLQLVEEDVPPHPCFRLVACSEALTLQVVTRPMLHTTTLGKTSVCLVVVLSVRL